MNTDLSRREVGGGGDKRAKCGLNEMFERMCAWDDQNYVMAAGTKAGRFPLTNKFGGVVVVFRSGRSADFPLEIVYIVSTCI